MSREHGNHLATNDTTVTAAVCTHHWVIETPTGPVSRGTCKLCGGEREFKNYLENTPYWEDVALLDQVSSGARFRTSQAAAESSDAAEE
jgi:hypothetical protein